MEELIKVICEKHGHPIAATLKGNDLLVSTCWECLEDHWQGGREFGAEEALEDYEDGVTQFDTPQESPQGS